MIDTACPTGDRLARLLDHLGIENAHFGACLSGDWAQFVTDHACRVLSLTVIMPHLNKGVPEGLDVVPFPSLVIAGDRGKPAETASSLFKALKNAENIKLENYCSSIWADTVADWKIEIASTMREFLNRAKFDEGLACPNITPGEGLFEGICYRVEGSGPPLVLMPLSLSPSQWEPIIPILAEQFCIIRLFGPRLGAVALLEARVNSGYGDLVDRLLQQAGIKPGERVLEVGCGTGALTRKVAAIVGESGKTVTGTDINDYLLSEARILAQNEGMAQRIQFEKADSRTLPYDDAQFDLVLSCTVLEEGDADKMASEINRVLRPGGRAVIMTRAIDVQWIVNLQLPSALQSKLGTLGPKTGAGVSEGGCADFGLYRLFGSIGFMPKFMGPLFAIYDSGDRLDMVLDRLITLLEGEERELFKTARHNVKSEQALFVGEPFHCFVGVKGANI